MWWIGLIFLITTPVIALVAFVSEGSMIEFFLTLGVLGVMVAFGIWGLKNGKPW